MKPLNFGKTERHYQYCSVAPHQITQETGSFGGLIDAHLRSSVDIAMSLPSEKPVFYVRPCIWSLQRE
jgi:hypothetical protein